MSMTNARERGTPTPLAIARPYRMPADFISSLPRKIEMKTDADQVTHKTMKMTVTNNGGPKTHIKATPRKMKIDAKV